MISDLVVSKDEAGFPILAWRELRGIRGPDPLRMSAVECRIMKDAETGELLFAKRSSTRRGAFEDGRPWESLIGFELKTAAELYESPMHRTVMERSKVWQMMRDTSRVVVALFKNETSLHLNCAEASETDFEELVVKLTKTFVIARRGLVDNCPCDLYYWPVDDGKVETLAAKSATTSERTTRTLDLLASVSAIAIVLALIGSVAWFGGAFGR